LERNRVIATSLTHPVTDVYRSLRAQVLRGLARLDRTTLGITSAGPGEGKTLTAVNLAISIAMDVNQTVMLVDADLRDPGVASCLGFAPELGLDDYLAGRASIADCLVNPGIERLSILPTRGRAGNSAELLASPQMAQLARELKGRYPDRLILYDLPPLLTSGDTLGFLSSVEATLLVVREGVARAADLKRAAALLAEHNLVGTVLNAAT
jgi:Mrp family chromosome partitioning ATPase